MASIEWWYARTGPGQVGEIASYSAPVQSKLKSEAHRIAANARGILASEPKVRTGAPQVEVEQHDLDYYVSLTDPEGKGGAAGIEMHFGVLRRSV